MHENTDREGVPDCRHDLDIAGSQFIHCVGALELMLSPYRTDIPVCAGGKEYGVQENGMGIGYKCFAHQNWGGGRGGGNINKPPEVMDPLQLLTSTDCTSDVLDT